MPLVEKPATWHAGIYQMRPALFGWQFRIRIYGLTWEPWRFVFGRRSKVRDRIRAMLGPNFVEVADWSRGQP